MFFTGDKPAAQFEEGNTKLMGGHFPFGSCSVNVKQMDNFHTAFHYMEVTS